MQRYNKFLIYANYFAQICKNLLFTVNPICQCALLCLSQRGLLIVSYCFGSILMAQPPPAAVKSLSLVLLVTVFLVMV